MGITEKTRKRLWAKSGNRCSICKKELFNKSEKENKDFNIGEECHIISSKKSGPRHKDNLDSYDEYDNLLLLCRNHHKEIDEVVETFSEELLRYIKQNHENWVQKAINNAIENEKEDKPRFLIRVTSGKELLQIISNSLALMTDYDEVDNLDDANFIGSIFQNLMDYADICGDAEPFERVQMGYQLNEILKDLEIKGYYLFAERSNEIVEFGKNKSDNWEVAIIVIKKSDNKEIIKINLNEKK
jgi:hypothetical protein